MRPSFFHVELTSRCNKSCWMCGRRAMEREHPELCDWGDMPIDMAYDLSRQIPLRSVVQFHNNGEPLLYPHLAEVLRMFSGHIRSLNTNAILLNKKSGDLIGNLETIAVSVIQDDPLWCRQLLNVMQFLREKGDEKPVMVYRMLGKIHSRLRAKYQSMPGLVADRVLHSPAGSREYRRDVTVPEIGMCLDLLTHLAVDRYGNISMCVRFDPQGKLRLGNIKEMTLEEAWNGAKRQTYIEHHLRQQRADLPGCRKCEFFGVPIGGNKRKRSENVQNNVCTA